MFAVLIGLLLISNTVLCQNPDVCGSQYADVRKGMCKAAADAVMAGVGHVKSECQDVQTTDGKPLKVFSCEVSGLHNGAPAVATVYLTPCKTEGGKILSVNPYDCTCKKGEKLSCTLLSPPVESDISL